MGGRSTLLIGYDVESGDDPEVVSRFLESAEELHVELSAPCTFFTMGRVAENNRQELSDLRERCGGLIDIQQHTYSHVLLKTVIMDDGEKLTMVRGGTLEQIEEEVSRTNSILKEGLGVDCIGLTGPWAYYRGLSDRPDILEILDRHGIKFVRTWGRNEKDFQPVPIEIQPFFYEVQGFPKLMEFPIHGWQDVHWRMLKGWEKVEEYREYLEATADETAGLGVVWSHGTHDWSSIKEDSEMTIMRGLIERAQDRGFRIVDYRTYYLEALQGEP